jgi:dUTP pyrophosphatase
MSLTTLDVQIKILDSRIHEWGIPKPQTETSAAVDLFACNDIPIFFPPGSAAGLISAGISIQIRTPGWAAIIIPRSGAGHTRGLVLGNTVGLIDPDYTGPLKVSVWNRHAHDGLLIHPGDRIAQLMFIPYGHGVFNVVDEFDLQTARGAGGFGSTG